MLRLFCRGLMVLALIVCMRAALAAGAGDDSNIAADVRAALKQLDNSSDHTAASRLNLAKVAISSANAKAGKDPQGAIDIWKAAHEALLDAARLEPGNKEVADLMPQVIRHIPPPPVRPATVPASTGPASKPGPDSQPAAVPFTVKREVTPAEINRIRQLEWRADENPRPVMRVDPDVKKKYIATTPGLNPAAANSMLPPELARAILDSGRDDLYPGVHITTDPASMREYKIAVDRVIVQNCATAACHTGNKAGRFNLFVEKNDAAVYSNFLILQRYDAVVNNAQRLMVDRTTPESSLLLTFMLPPDQTDAPHPPVPGYKPPAHNKNDPKYQAVLKWLKSLDPLAPNYGIDLSAAIPAPIPVPKK